MFTRLFTTGTICQYLKLFPIICNPQQLIDYNDDLYRQYWKWLPECLQLSPSINVKHVCCYYSYYLKCLPDRFPLPSYINNYSMCNCRYFLRWLPDGLPLSSLVSVQHSSQIVTLNFNWYWHSGYFYSCFSRWLPDSLTLLQLFTVR